MRIPLIILCLLLICISNSSHAQFIGLRLGIPNETVDYVGNGGTVIPNNAMTFKTQYMTFNGKYMTFSGTP